MSETVFIHGCAGQTSSWDAVIAGLSGEMALRHLGLPGHGAGAQPPAASDFDEAIDALWAELGDGGDLRLAGYSLGARVAMGMAVRRPGRVSELLLIAGHPGLETEVERAARREWDQGWADRLRDRGMEAFVDEWEGLPIFATQRSLPAAARQAHRVRRLDHEVEGLAWSFEKLGLGSMPSWWAGMRQFDGRLSVLVGERDHKYRQLGRRLVDGCPGGTLVVVPGRGHDLLLEAPDVVAACLRSLGSGGTEPRAAARVRP